MRLQAIAGFRDAARADTLGFEEWLFGDFAYKSFSWEWREICKARDVYIDHIEKTGGTLASPNARRYYEYIRKSESAKEDRRLCPRGWGPDAPHW
jgi:hypothetical protein